MLMECMKHEMKGVSNTKCNEENNKASKASKNILKLDTFRHFERAKLQKQ